ncbi:uncharacterized protein BO80DRAFT_250573 [Aspergillus ibericus CBS 121593]|uniref:Uncharacterized protein n=1 Tax=Aspergillus ibericus CBS 121593 TaxID=1448316 RepID=A0A395GL92_9EURO|nr:hypothetical protein BO80DRAFT_250573 [Aspergillus ibericus CBS 121593]RAK95748.1 hypothetical protein BO80DRAFT_250573 [Aspergillus ibericus CBS 121593]
MKSIWWHSNQRLVVVDGGLDKFSAMIPSGPAAGETIPTLYRCNRPSSGSTQHGLSLGMQPSARSSLVFTRSWIENLLCQVWPPRGLRSMYDVSTSGLLCSDDVSGKHDSPEQTTAFGGILLSTEFR